MAPYPFLRKLTLRLPRALWPVPPAYGHVIAFTEDGRIVADLQDPSGAYAGTTAVTETRPTASTSRASTPIPPWLAAGNH